MKLLKKINQSYLAATGIALLAGLVVIYFVLLRMVRTETDEKLYNNTEHIVSEIETTGKLPEIPPFIETTETRSSDEMSRLGDTSFFDTREREAEPYRQLVTVRKIGGRFYRITVRSSEIENGEFLMSVFIILAGVYTVFMTGIFLYIRRRTSRLWSPFFKNLSFARNFSLSGLQPVHLEETGIDEFDEMKRVVEQLTRRAMDDYRNLKQFTANASHEMQTPLAVIRSKMEALLNDGQLTTTQLERIKDVSSSVNRLSNTHRSLLLLARIENGQFPEKRETSFRTLLIEQSEQFSELVKLKQITLTGHPGSDFTHVINPGLASIIVSNLLGNAIRHTEEGGEITVLTYR